MTDKNDLNFEYELDPVSGNMHIRVKGTMPGTTTCTVCGTEFYGYAWRLEDGKLACVTCGSKPPKAS